MGWTLSKTWANGSKSEVETFTGAGLPAPIGSNTSSTGVVVTLRDANKTFVRDQADKWRMSETNALGQLPKRRGRGPGVGGRGRNRSRSWCDPVAVDHAGPRRNKTWVCSTAFRRVLCRGQNRKR